MSDVFRGVPGVPEGWEAVRFDYVSEWEFWLDKDGDPIQHTSCFRTQCKQLIIRKIEKPKRYRPFANAAEFKPHRDRWIRFASDDSSACWKVSWYRDDGVFLNHGPERRHLTFGLVFEEWTFDDGTPFGVEVTDGE
jgi:hypothetical protein